MKVITQISLAVLVFYQCTLIAQQSNITTVIIVRHAEKVIPEKDGENIDMMTHDVSLTEAGEQRAAKLAQMLRESNVSAVFSTNTTRTIETVNNYADQQEIEIIIYDDTDNLAEIIKSDYRGNRQHRKL